MPEMTVHRPTFTVALILIAVLVGCISDTHAQDRLREDATSPPMRLGFTAGVQTNLLRYSVFPFEGEFQIVTGESAVFGVSMHFPIDENWSLQAEITMWEQAWSTRQDREPSFAVERNVHAVIDFPLLVVYRLPVPIIPLYMAAGPQVMIANNAKDAFVVRYRGFSERSGWQENAQSFDQTALRLAGAAEIGLDLPLPGDFSVQVSMRMLFPFLRAVDEDVLSVKDFSYWRFGTRVLLAI